MRRFCTIIMLTWKNNRDRKGVFVCHFVVLFIVYLYKHLFTIFHSVCVTCYTHSPVAYLPTDYGPTVTILSLWYVIYKTTAASRAAVRSCQSPNNNLKLIWQFRYTTNLSIYLWFAFLHIDNYNTDFHILITILHSH